MNKRICSVEDCGQTVKTRQMCSRHYQRWLKENESWRPKGRPHTPESRAKLSASKRGSKNPMFGKTEAQHPNWKGNQVGYFGVHDWMTSRYGQPNHCEQCGTTDPDTRYEWANISGEYRRERSDFIRLCKRCHNNHDQINVWQVAPSRRNRAMAAVNGKPVSSKYKGVRDSGHGTWRATLKVGGKITNLGSFPTEEAAAIAYNAAVLEAHGQDAYLNEIT